MKKLFPLIVFLFISSCIFSQTKEDEARVLYGKAEQAFDAAKYDECLDYLQKVSDKLDNENNPKIKYLLIKVLQKTVTDPQYDNENLKLWKDIAFNCKSFFSMVDKGKYPEEKYNEILGIKLGADEMLAKLYIKRQKYLDLKNRETAFIRDTINPFWIDFCRIYGELHKKINAKWALAAESLLYDTTNHILTINEPTSGFIKQFFRGGNPTTSVLKLSEVSINKNQYSDDIIIYFEYHGHTDPAWEKQINNDFSKNGYISIDGTGHDEKKDFYLKQFGPSPGKGDFDISTSLLPKIQRLLNILETTGFKDYFFGKFSGVIKE